MSIFALKQQFARVVGRSLTLDRLIVRARERYVLCYHRVLPPARVNADHVHSAMWIAPETFAAQIEWMQSVGEIVDYRGILDRTSANERPLFTITFDDGWRDNYEYALPILEHYRAPALIFLATAAIDSGELFWPEDVVTKTEHALRNGRHAEVHAGLSACDPRADMSGKQSVDPSAWAEDWVEKLKLFAESERKARIAAYYLRIGASETPLPGYVMSWDEVRDMHVRGVEFGSHTHTHKILKGLPAGEIEGELRQSSEAIRRELGSQVDTFCYPNARYNGDEGAVLERCGYRYGFRIDNLSLKHCVDDHFVPRILVYEGIAAAPEYFKLRLLEAPFYRGPKE